MKIKEYIRQLHQLAQVIKNPDLIKDMDNPGTTVQLAAVKRNPKVIEYIKNPPEKVQLAAIEKDISTLMYIYNQTEYVQLTALKMGVENINNMVPVSEKVMMAAINEDPYAITFFDGTEKVNLAVVRKDPLQILNIEDPSQGVCIAALHTQFGNLGDLNSMKGRADFIGKTWHLFRELRDVEINYKLILKKEGNSPHAMSKLAWWKTEEISKAVDNVWPEFFREVLENGDGGHLPESTLLSAVQTDSSLIMFVDNPSEKVQLAAVLKDPSCISNIKNPTDKVRKAAEYLNTNLNIITRDYANDPLNRHATYRGIVMKYKETLLAEMAAGSATVQKHGISSGNKTVTNVHTMEETRFRGGRREMLVKDGRATITSNGKASDADDILKVMKKQGVDIKNVSENTMADLLKGNKVSLPGSTPNTLFAIAKGPAGYTLKAFQAARQVINTVAQEL